MNAPIHFSSYGQRRVDSLLFAHETGESYSARTPAEREKLEAEAEAEAAVAVAEAATEEEPEAASDWKHVHEHVLRLDERSEELESTVEPRKPRAEAALRLAPSLAFGGELKRSPLVGTA